MATFSNVLKNPAYAGTFVYGKTRTSKTGPSAIDKVTRKLPQEQWKVIIPNKYPAYIATELFDTIQNMLKENYSESIFIVIIYWHKIEPVVLLMGLF